MTDLKDATVGRMYIVHACSSTEQTRLHDQISAGRIVDVLSGDRLFTIVEARARYEFQL